MHHNAQLQEYGACHCQCHLNLKILKCQCGWLKFFPRQGPMRHKIRSEKLTSRVKAFGSWQPKYKMAPTNNHRTHAEIFYA